MTPGSDPQPQPERPGPPPLPPQGQPPQGPRPPRPPQQQRRPQQQPQRRPLPPRPPPRQRRHHHHGKASRARVGLVVVFLIFRMLDFLTLYNYPQEVSRLVLSHAITSAMWTTALLVGIWLRKPWARLILIALLGLGAIAMIIVFPMLTDFPSLTVPIVCALLVNSGVCAWLVLSRDVRRLVSRERE